MDLKLTEDEFNRQLQEEFLIEAEELVEAIERALSQLAKSPDDSYLLDEAFRAAHTIKGSALAVKLEDLGHFTHRIEAALSEQQAQLEASEPDKIKALLAATDLLFQYIEGLKADRRFRLDPKQLDQRLQDMATASAPTSPKSASETGTVLLVEDDAGVRDVMAGELENLGYEVKQAEDGMVAVKMFAKSYRPDVVLTDLRMPNLAGDELVKTLFRAAPDIPIVVYSGYAERSDIINFLNSGAFAFIEKPIDSSLLMTTLEHAMRERRRREKLARLTSLNLRAFMLVAKTSAQIKDQANDSLRQQLSKLESMFQELGDLLRDINQP